LVALGRRLRNHESDELHEWVKYREVAKETKWNFHAEAPRRKGMQIVGVRKCFRVLLCASAPWREISAVAESLSGVVLQRVLPQRTRGCAKKAIPAVIATVHGNYKEPFHSPAVLSASAVHLY
jgi:hypothetical protein